MLNEKVLKTHTGCNWKSFVAKQNLCVENMTLPSLWQQAESEHDKMKETPFQALPALQAKRGTF